MSTTNPYQPIEEASAGSVEYAFEGVIGERDIAALHRRTRLWAIILAIQAAFFLKTGIDSIRARGTTSGYVILVLGIVWVWLTFRLWRWPQRAIKANRFLIGHVRGTLGSHQVRIESHGTTSTVDSESININRITSQGIGLVMSTYRYLPRELFSDFEGARQLAEALKRDAKPLVPGDDRLKKEHSNPPVDSAPPDAIRFSGPVLSGDFHTSEVKKSLWTVRGRILIWVALTVLIGDIAYRSSDDPAVAAVAMVIAGIVFYRWQMRTLLQALRSFKTKQAGEDNVMFFLRGWIDPEGLSTWTSVGNSRFLWSAFESGQFRNPDTIVLQLLPRASYIALHRRLFESDDAWNEACELIPTAVSNFKATQ